MAPRWEQLDRDDFAIAHISDMHLGSRNFPAVWDVAAQFIRDQVKPELVLVTGDLVDTPDLGLYNEAYSELRGLNARFMVCPGNHDRHPLGNRMPVDPRKWLERFKMTSVAARFDSVFAEEKLSPGTVKPHPLGSGRNRWNIGLLGIDSSENADLSARGYVKETTFDDIRRATQKVESDLCIFLVHHHLLSVARLESSKRGSTRDLFNLTCLVNCGSLLEALAESHVDVVLHGHEHRTHEASYGSFAAGSGPVRVIGAGSVTGNAGVSGAHLDRATFNVLVLSADRSAAVRRLVWDSHAWKVDERNSFTLVDPSALRHSRLRRTRPDIGGEITAAIAKDVEFTRSRDIVVHWILYNWKLEEDHVHWSLSNSTGTLDEVKIELRPAKGRPQKMPVKPKRQVDQDHTWSIDWTVPAELRRQTVDVQLVYRWRSGGILTQSEMNAVKGRSAPGLYRGEGLEFSSIETRRPLKSIELHLTLPHEYAPDDVGLRVRGGDAEEACCNLELRSYLSTLSRGRYVWRVPYPQIERLYSIVWQPVDDASATKGEKYAVFRAASRERGFDLLRGFASVFESTPLHDRATFGLYVGLESGYSLERMAFVLPAEASVAAPPERVELAVADPSPMTQAWHGEPVLAESSDPGVMSKLGLVEGEVALIAVPLRFSLDWNTPPPWGVVRMGIVSDEGLRHVRDRTRKWSLLSAATMRLLTDFFSGG